VSLISWIINLVFLSEAKGLMERFFAKEAQIDNEFVILRNEGSCFINDKILRKRGSE